LRDKKKEAHTHAHTHLQRSRRRKRAKEVKYVKLTTTKKFDDKQPEERDRRYTTRTTAIEKKPSPIKHLTSHTLDR